MKQAVAVKPVPDANAREALTATLRVCNAEADRVAQVAFAHRDRETGQVGREFAIRGRVYADVKATGIGAQSAQHAVEKVRDAYAVVYAQIRAGRLRSGRAAKASAKPVRCRLDSAQPFDKVSKQIVPAAERTGRGIALEDLEGIRERVRLARSQRGRISQWPFHQPARHIAYKAKRAGVAVVTVDARRTSRTCPLCRHTERADRRSRDEFECRGCGLAGPADAIAAVNVRRRGRRAWAVSQGSGGSA